MTRPLLIVVAAALIDEDGRTLVQQRPAGKAMAGLWEFPGGKVEAGESPEAALVRELEEELGLVVELRDLDPAGFASEPLGDRHLLLMLYECRRWEGTPFALEASDLKWASIAELRDLPMPPADAPLVDQLDRLMEMRVSSLSK